MSASIDQAFVKQYQSEVQEAYQRQGSKLRPTVRSKTDVRGASTVFQKVGRGTASAKARNGVVPVMNLDHSSVECFLQDYYAGDWVDRLDELKLAMLNGQDGAPALERLARSLREERPDEADAGLKGVLDQIDLRAAVEMAKAEAARARA